MTAALALMAKERGDVTFVQQSMYYPVTDAAMNTASYDEFATGYYLSRKEMEWFWDSYAPDPAQRTQITASPKPGHRRAARRAAARLADGRRGRRVAR